MYLIRLTYSCWCLHPPKLCSFRSDVILQGLSTSLFKMIKKNQLYPAPHLPCFCYCGGSLVKIFDPQMCFQLLLKFFFRTNCFVMTEKKISSRGNRKRPSPLLCFKCHRIKVWPFFWIEIWHQPQQHQVRSKATNTQNLTINFLIQVWQHNNRLPIGTCYYLHCRLVQLVMPSFLFRK